MDELPDTAATTSARLEDDAAAAFSKMTHEELQKECNSLKKQNGLLNCRLLGVNELARLLQEKTETVETYKDKNKRLELAVVRLENRCSNMDKKAKTQQHHSSTSLPSAPASSSSSSSSSKGTTQQQQSPFIPGPSKQILETLMRENTDLKKTLDNMTNKGPTGYREAVKMNQLEEVIDQKNEKIEMLSGQLQSLTAANKDGDSGGADVGTLQRQLLKMEHSMKVKDRFCTLLSERVNQLQRELQDANKVRGFEEFDGGLDSGVSQTESIPPPGSWGELTREHEVKERNMRKMMDELQQQVEREREDKINAITQAEDHRQKLIEKQNELDTLQSKFDDSNLYTESLLNEKLSLIKQLEDIKSDSTSTGDVKDPSRSQYQREIENKNMQIDQLKRLLEDAQYKYALAESKQVHFERIEELEEKVKDLEDERSALENEIFDNKRKIQELMHQNTKLRFGNLGTHTPYVLRSGGAPALNLQSHRGEDVFADSSKSIHDMVKDTLRHEVPPINYQPRDVGTDGNTDSTSVSVATPTYTTPESSNVRTLQSSTNQTASSSSSSSSVSSSRANYRPNVASTPVMTSHVYPGGSQVLGPYPYQDTVAPRHPYQPSDALLYQTHSVPGGTQITGYNPQYSVPMHFGSSARGTAMGVPLQRSLSSSPGPYLSSSFPLHSSVPAQNPQVTQSTSAIFGQQPPSHPSPYSGGSSMMFGGASGYATTPTAYAPQYPGQPGQRYDPSQLHGGSMGFFTGSYGMAPTSSAQGTNAATSGNSSFATAQQQQQPGGPPTGPMQRRHSPPDPR